MADTDPFEADLLMYAIGRKPNTDGLGLEAAGVDLDGGGAIIVNADNQSTCDSIYAVGDVTNRIQLTPIAIKGKLKKSDFDATVALHPTMAEELVLMR